MAEIIWETPIEQKEDNYIEAPNNIEAFVDKNEKERFEQIYLKDKPGFVDIGNGILKYENFLNGENYNYLLFQCDSLDEESWSTHPTGSDLYGRISIPIGTQVLSSTVIEAIVNEYWTNEHNTVNRTRPNDDVSRSWGGADSWKSADYVLCYYLGEWTGGDVTILSDDSKLKLETNTLYCFPINEGQQYQSDEVESGIKYSYVDWIYKHSDWIMG
jgi:hypothetical protein